MRKLSFEENLRHRLQDLPRFHYRDERARPSEGALFLALGAVAGIAAGVVVAQRFGGFSALATKLRERFESDEETVNDEYEDDEYEGDDEDADGLEELSPLEELEERVLEAYHNDPILSERAIDIGAIDEGIIELTGWVYAAGEAEHAVTVARGTPGVATVLNRLAVRAEEDQLEESAERYEAGDDSLTEAHWEGQGVGMGRKRQGNSSETDRNIDPKPALEDKWMNEGEAYRSAADAMEGVAERRKKPPAHRGARNDGSAISPSGVPKADNVASSENAPPAV
ncbi:MAG: BON domain-containing protein [Gemmatimonadota bacterium]|nr:BON domain-containing protein [Gemmatimonadota bacterium]